MIKEKTTMFISGKKGKIKFPKTQSPVIAIDLGFSKSRKSCGIAWKDNTGKPKADNFKFSEALGKVHTIISNSKNNTAVLIIEAPLSGNFDEQGNPVSRGDFEKPNKKNHEWYLRAGAAMALAAIFFLKKLSDNLINKHLQIHLYEGFFTGKSKPKQHKKVAEKLLNCFLSRNPRFANFYNVGELISISDVIEKTPPAVICPK
jgi:hypothetical protein